MGNTYMELVGPPPDPRTFAHRDWRERLLRKWIDYCDQPRTTTYYFDTTTGDDSDSGLTPALAKETLGEAQTIHDASSGDIELLFKTGEIFPVTGAAFLSTKDNVTVGTYTGDDDNTAESDGPVVLNRFRIVSASGGALWSQVGATDAYEFDYSGLAANAPDWVCITEDRLRVLKKATSLTDPGGDACDDNDWSWWYDDTGGSEILYVNLAGMDPDDVGIEIVEANDDSSVVIRGDGNIRKGDIQTFGFGFNYGRAGGSNEYGSQVATADGKLAVILGGGSWYNSTHGAGHYPRNADPDAAGGLAAIVNVKVGLCAPDSDGGTSAFNSYRADGGQETIFENCEVTHGTAPLTTDVASMGVAWNAHTSGGGATVGLMIVSGLTVAEGSLGSPGCNNPGGATPAHLPAATTIGDARCFVVDLKARIITDGRMKIPRSNAVYINPDVEIMHLDVVSLNNESGAITGAWMLNGRLVIDLAENTQTYGSLYLEASNDAIHTHQLLHTGIYIKGNQTLATPAGVTAWTTDGRLWFQDKITSSLSLAANCLFVVYNPGTAGHRLGIYDDADTIKNNAYHQFPPEFNAVQGHHNDAGMVNLDWQPKDDCAPPVGSELDGAGNNVPQLEFDQNWNARDMRAPTIGPYEVINELAMRPSVVAGNHGLSLARHVIG